MTTAFSLTFCVALLMTALCSATLAAEPAIYPLPAIHSVSKTYAVAVNGKPVPVNAYNGDYEYAHFSMGDGPVDVDITALTATKIDEHDISPWKLKIAPKVTGNRLRFRLERDQYLIIQINDLRRLVLAADPKETDVPVRGAAGVLTVGDEVDRTGNVLVSHQLQSVLDAAHAYGEQHGQGVVYIPAGVYLVGNLTLKSNTAVYLEGGAVLRCTDDRSQLTPHWKKNSINSEVTWWIHTEVGAKNVKLYGRGTLDGNGWNLWHKHEKGQRIANNLLVPMHASGFTCDGLIVRDPSAWAVVPVRSDHVTFTNFKLFNRLNMGENDGLDVVESQHVVIRNTIGIALDDPYSFKTWAAETDIALNWKGDPEPNENILLERAISWTHCYGYKVGQGVLQPQRNITVRDAVVYDAAVGLGIHHRYGDAPASNITFEDIEIERQHGANDGKGTWFACLVDKRNPRGGGLISNVLVRNVNVHAVGHTPAMLRGISEQGRIDGLTFDNVRIDGKLADTLHALNVTNRDRYDNVKILPKQGDEPPQRVNIAIGTTATASSSESKNTAARAIDGDYGTRWASDHADPQWLAVDLGQARRIDGVQLVWEYAHAKSYEIQVSDDGNRWRTVFKTNTGKGGSEEVRFKATSARYVRMHGTQRGAKYGYSLWEFAVYEAK